MKKLYIIIGLILIVQYCLAAAPSRTSTYTSGTTIRSADVTANEDAIFNYLSAGVDTIKDGSVTNADVSASAAIANSKLNLTTVTQDITHSGTLTQSGTLTSSGSAAFTTITNLGAVTTGDINGGTIDGTNIGVSSAGTGTFTTIKANTSLQLATGATVTGILDEDDMASDSATQLATQQSIKAYADALTPVTQGNDVETTGVSCDTSEDTVLSVTKTITSGKTVLLIASGENITEVGNPSTLTLKLKNGSTVSQTLTLGSGPGSYNHWSTSAIVTGLSGSTVFTVTGQTGNDASVVYGNLSVIEF